ncbi:MAG: Asp-tRNA(Asn)/Glu-tRNA(Gln) amidotransferase subunit GatC [Bdellovibrionota bacterium]
MSLTEKDIRHVAKLSALKLSDEEVAVRCKEVGDILEYVERLSAVSTRGVVPTSHVHGVVNFFRDDIIRDSLPVEDLESLAPDFKNSSFRVPKIIS